jgi:hypothetical protein
MTIDRAIKCVREWARERASKCVPHGSDGLEEVDELGGVAAVAKVEVEPVGHLLDADGVGVRVVLEDELLEVEEGALVIDLLARLHDGLPRVIGEAGRASRALHHLHDELDDEHLLEDGRREDLLLHGDLHLEPSRVSLGPHEAGVDQLDLVHALDALQTERQQLARLELAVHPRVRRHQVPAHATPRETPRARNIDTHRERERGKLPATVLALVNNDALGDALGDVDLPSDAGHAHVRRIGLDVDTANAAKTLR